ncbi:MAG: ABC transporter permease, partial [Balneolales bacterium]|nr:ABC transporter permease [Balneolales bacterium]
MMLKNYIKIAWRNIIKNRLYSFINIFGLTIGFTGSLLITIYVIDELSYDNFHENGDQIYRVLREFDLPDLKSAFQYTPSALAPTVRESISGVDKAVRVQPYSETVRVNGKSFIESSFIMADDGFFDVFDFNIVEGKAELEQPNTLVISKTMAEKYFGNESPVGKMLSIGASEMEVTGVIADVPRNSHLQFHFVTATPPQQLNWGRNSFITYILLDPNQSADLVTNQIAELINVNTGQSSDAANHDFIPHLQPLEGIHFGTGVNVSITAMGNIAYVYLFIVLACFILVLACVNFINLTTARSVEKSREVGIRKTLGGQRTQIIVQFLGEAVLLSAIAACIALAITQFSLPLLSSIAGKSLGMNSINSGFIW